MLVPEDAPIRVNDTLNNGAGSEERYTPLLVLPNARESEANSGSPKADSEISIRAGGGTSCFLLDKLWFWR